MSRPRRVLELGDGKQAGKERREKEERSEFKWEEKRKEKLAPTRSTARRRTNKANIPQNCRFPFLAFPGSRREFHVSPVIPALCSLFAAWRACQVMCND